LEATNIKEKNDDWQKAMQEIENLLHKIKYLQKGHNLRGLIVVTNQGSGVFGYLRDSEVVGICKSLEEYYLETERLRAKTNYSKYFENLEEPDESSSTMVG